MGFDSIFWVAIQSSLVLGLVHGVNPCGHSWLVLAPFVCGEKRGGRVLSLTLAFIVGTTFACLLIGLTLGSVSLTIPESFTFYVDLITFAVLLALGLTLIIKPELLHSHDHEHGGEHSHDHAHHHHNHEPHARSRQCDCHAHGKLSAQSMTVWGLFTIGFMNMIVPCPTVALMYTYALNSGSVLRGTLVFAVYALSTGVTLAGVIYAIYKAAGLVRTLSQEWVEPLVMRAAGVMTIGFGAYALYTSL